MKHTPGPWRVHGLDLEMNGEIVGIAPAPDGATLGEKAANAALIAAAPELLAACEWAAKSPHHPACMCRGERAANPERHCTCHIQAANLAIAKAKGGA